jgi:hypothetical protein
MAHLVNLPELLSGEGFFWYYNQVKGEGQAGKEFQGERKSELNLLPYPFAFAPASKF